MAAWALRTPCGCCAPGGSALNAVEAGIRCVEDNPEDHTIGTSGLPNLLGEVELDASIMDGHTLQAGAVGAVKTGRAPHLPRPQGDGGAAPRAPGRGGPERFARELGVPEANLLTPEAERIWREFYEGNVPEVYRERPEYSRASAASPGARPIRSGQTRPSISSPGHSRASGHGCQHQRVGLEVSGPGGDSPVIGAGNYADNRYGAAACTGRGEMAMRACTAFSAVLYMKMGRELEAAGRAAVTDLAHLVDPYFGRVSLIAMDARGNHAGFSNAPDATYVYMADDMQTYAEAPRTHVATGDEGRRA